MAAGLVLQFQSGVGEQEYDQVNSRLRFDPRTGEGDWPTGLLSHSAGPAGDAWVVSEIWDSKESQAEFLRNRLGPATADFPPPSMLWYDVVASQHTH